MEAKSLIYAKLEAFIRKFYTNEVIRGTILFTALGLLYFIFTLLLEYFLWLPQGGRTALFWIFILVEAILLARFILFPVFKLFKLQKGIGYKEASTIIGNHFSEVSDRLTNFLQLSNEVQQSELLLASIEQKANSLQPIPFTNAINFKKNSKYLPYAAVPVLLILFFLISGNSKVITQSFDRVVHYNTHYAPPAPFEFIVVNNPLIAQQGADFTLEIKTQGSVIPENAMINIGSENYYLENVKPGIFTYTFEKPTKAVSFQLSANNVTSQPYELNVVAVPTIANFEMVLNFPAYLGKKQEVVQGTGNAVVPDGTKVTWKVNAVATTDIQFSHDGAQQAFVKEDNTFTLSKTILQNTEYQILTSNSKVKNHEKLQYQITTVKDQYPTISVQSAPDSLNLKKDYILGQLSDDYGLTKLQIVYYPQDNPNAARRGTLPVKREPVDRFYYSFPTGLDVKAGVDYEYYFEVFDNDAVHNYKSTKSSVFSHRELTQSEKEDKALQEQNSNINSLENAIKNQDKQMGEMDKLQKMGKEKKELDFKDQKKVDDFIKRQQMQEQRQQELSKKLHENLDQFMPEKEDEFKQELMKRLEKNEAEAQKNEKLLEELKELNKKLSEEELFEKMDQFKKNAKSQIKNLEQLVELTKRYYVEKKAEQIAEKLQQLAEKQDKLSENKDNNAQKQDQLNKEFNQLQKEMRELDKQNQELAKPMDIPADEKKEQGVKSDMDDAKKELQKEEQQEQNSDKQNEQQKEEQKKSKQKAKNKQKSASEKMKQMGADMMQSMMGGEMEMLQEDVKMLRQILDNLLAYSFSQEDVMGQFRGNNRHSSNFAKNLKRQQDLKQQFRHVDDSLFAMSLRNPRISEDITKEVGNVHYYVDKALADLAENAVGRGVSNQQYAITSANKLADFLSDMLNNMQMEMNGQGMGGGKSKQGQQGNEPQLGDIIQKQEGLSKKMQEGMKGKDGKGKQGEGQPGGEGQGGEGEGSEGDAGKILEIYKEQQQLREQLQQMLEKEGMGGNGQAAAKKMKDIEKQLLNKGFDNQTLEKMQNLKHELLKLENAMKQQGQDNKRQSQTNKKDYNNTSNQLPEALKEYLNGVEILNRQSLPLRPNFNQKVQQYFKNND
ncbi:glutamyl-tRNA synthetase [Flavobacterium akiainvivens]|uniref:Glutamyl-tRNA synthetase n=1 Tax=Flavobacterium akiainvivens TaxID=1202724 RepID=A0A0M9VIU5_9FLAO|nr:DUF4175 family protein [Flavobacterium akiainvivens]KOS07052.1 glutamyl-tRNA synthetase [Flavobacterium akiainvivens]SFQ58730.1 hypothetical protein SAMN05444144_10937 [Flavobacterium akiainvivens]